MARAGSQKKGNLAAASGTRHHPNPEANLAAASGTRNNPNPETVVRNSSRPNPAMKPRRGKTMGTNENAPQARSNLENLHRTRHSNPNPTQAMEEHRKLAFESAGARASTREDQAINQAKTRSRNGEITPVKFNEEIAEAKQQTKKMKQAMQEAWDDWKKKEAELAERGPGEKSIIYPYEKPYENAALEAARNFDKVASGPTIWHGGVQSRKPTRYRVPNAVVEGMIAEENAAETNFLKLAKGELESKHTLALNKIKGNRDGGNLTNAQLKQIDAANKTLANAEITLETAMIKYRFEKNTLRNQEARIRSEVSIAEQDFYEREQAWNRYYDRTMKLAEEFEKVARQELSSFEKSKIPHGVPTWGVDRPGQFLIGTNSLVNTRERYLNIPKDEFLGFFHKEELVLRVPSEVDGAVMRGMKKEEANRRAKAKIDAMNQAYDGYIEEMNKLRLMNDSPFLDGSGTKPLKRLDRLMNQPKRDWNETRNEALGRAKEFDNIANRDLHDKVFS